MKQKWTKESATNYIKHAKEKGLKYWSAKDFLKNHRTMHSIIQEFIMNETKILDKISTLIDKINYKSVYIEIQTKKDKYTLEKEKRNKIGFDVK